MSPRRLRLCVAASATSLTLLAFIVAGTSSSASGLLLAVIGLIPPIVMPLILATTWFRRADEVALGIASHHGTNNSP